MNLRLAIVAAVLLLPAIPGLLFAQDSDQPPVDAAGVEFFEQKIRPVLVQHCYECHSATAKSLKGGLLLDTRAASRKGGDSGPAVIPKDVNQSLLISALQHDGFEMPPKGRLPDAVIADFVKWVEMGAPDPRDGEITASSIDFEKAAKHWAFQPITEPALPTVKHADWPASPIDYFTLARMEQLKLQPVEKAGKRELVRRATFDLTGLPPSPEDIAAFLADDSSDAFEKVINRLLESKHYGERWGRYWLDVARYAEDQAHTFAVTANTNGFRYRDWVVAAFNDDMPYDRFVQMQIAGDLIGAEAEGSYDHLVALGFFGLGAQYYKNSDAAKAAADELDDRVDTLTRGFLGLTVSCARCHDHKFDPVPAQDYYSLAGIFRSSKLHSAPLCDADAVQRYNDGQKRIKSLDESLKKFLADEKATAAETKVGEIAKYIEAVWGFRTAAANGQPVGTAKLAEAAGVNEFLLKRWIDFLDAKQQGKVAALDAWFALKFEPKSADPAAVPAEVSQLATSFQQYIQDMLNVRDGVATTNLVQADGKPHRPGSPRFVTPNVTKVRPTSGIDVSIKGAKQLFLVVSDGGNGNSCDHADWLAPRLVGDKGELKLTELKWKSLEGFGGGKVNRNYEGKPIRVGGKTYEEGIGVHAPSVIVYDLPEGYQRFKASGGLDNSGSDQGGCGDQASVQFSVYTEQPAEGPVGPGKDVLSLVLGKDGPLAVSDDDLENFLTGEKREQLVQLRADFEDAKQTAPAMYAIAHSYAEANAADMRVFVRGNPARQREVAPRRFLRILAGEDRPHFTNGSGRRELAAAIADASNPLTARVMVNRIWQRHFGRGIVATPSNFGTQGEPPTHPLLLDDLASRFIKSGWSIKALHREIMLSSTYQLGTANHETNASIDADNRFLWRMNRQRLDVEAWRDALLDVSGRLDRTLGGPSTNLADANNVRRTVYAKVSRHELDSLLRLFDFPDANITSAKRSETTVPQQQLFVLNSAFMVETAKAFAERLHREAPDSDEARIGRAFSLAYGRSPEPLEVEIALAYLQSEPDKDNRLTQWQSYAQILLAGNEFIYLD
jgi:cytochrome c553/mono/diheme cytochrome c family protein